MTKDPYVFLKFRAHSRHFHIRLKRDLVTFSDSLVVRKISNYTGLYLLHKTHVFITVSLAISSIVFFFSYIDYSILYYLSKPSFCHVPLPPIATCFPFSSYPFPHTFLFSSSSIFRTRFLCRLAKPNCSNSRPRSTQSCQSVIRCFSNTTLLFLVCPRW